MRLRAKLIVEVLSAVAFCFIIWRLFSLGVDWGAFRGIRIRTLAAFLVVFVIGTGIETGLWCFFQGRISPVSFRSALLVFASTVQFGYIPGRGGLILSRMHRARHLEPPIPYAESGASLFALFLLRFCVTFLCCLLLPVLFGPSWATFAAPLILVAGGALLLLVRRPLEGLVVGRILPAAFRRSGEEISAHFDRLRENVLRLVRDGKAVAVFLVAFLVEAVLEYSVMALFWVDLGHPVAVVHLTVVGLVSKGVGLASQLPGGLGAEEGTFAYLLSLQGVPGGEAVVVVLLFRALVLIHSFSLGLIGWLLWARRGRP